jgi:threonine dehydratase
VPDTSDDPRDPTTLHVMQGYGVMVLELIQQLGADIPAHVFIQAGVGGLAASVAGVLSEHYSKERPTFIVVEPEAAACLFESNLRLRPAKIAGDLRTEMAMLSAGEASAAAWPILELRIDAFLTIEDGAALSARAELVEPKNGDRALDVGTSGAAGIAGLTQVRASPRLSGLLGLSSHSRVVVFGTEWGLDDQRSSSRRSGTTAKAPARSNSSGLNVPDGGQKPTTAMPAPRAAVTPIGESSTARLSSDRADSRLTANR